MVEVHGRTWYAIGSLKGDIGFRISAHLGLCNVLQPLLQLAPLRRGLSLRTIRRSDHYLSHTPSVTMTPLYRIPRLVRPCVLRPSSSILRTRLLVRTTATYTPPTPTTPSAKPPATASVSSTIAASIPPDVYRPPTTGFLSYLPSSWVPYAELVRLDKPTGTIYLLLPCIWSTLLASSLTLASPLSVLGTCALFTSGAVIMRGAGCTINDLWDRRIDPLVTRTKFRPLARGAISTPKAVVFTGAQLLAGLGVLVNFPMEVIVSAIPSLLVVAAYPGMKRITHYPQVVLGAAFSWGAMLGFPAMGMSLLDPTTALTAGCLYASNVAWTVLYDTVYAQQDLKDDLKAGVKSTAVRWGQGDSAKGFLSALAVTQLSLLTAAGVVSGMGPCFYVGSVGGAALGLGWMIRRVKFGDVENCWAWFRWCAWAVGGVAIGGGLLGEYAVRKWEEQQKEEEEQKKMKMVAVV